MKRSCPEGSRIVAALRRTHTSAAFLRTKRLSMDGTSPPARSARRCSTADGLPEARAQPLRQLLEHVLLRGEIDDLLGLDHLARHVIEAAQAVGEPELHALLAGPDQSREHVGRLLQTVAAPMPHDG